VNSRLNDFPFSHQAASKLINIQRWQNPSNSAFSSFQWAVAWDGKWHKTSFFFETQPQPTTTHNTERPNQPYFSTANTTPPYF
jgi:hypothetical protein